MIERNGDSVISNFNIILDEDNEFVFKVEGTRLLRFLADIYGAKTIDDLSDDQKSSTAEDVIHYLAGTSKFAVGNYEEEGNTKSKFIPGKNYTKDELLKIITIRYSMNLTSFRKYIGTQVASDVSDKTVAVIMENIEIGRAHV